MKMRKKNFLMFLFGSVLLFAGFVQAEPDSSQAGETPSFSFENRADNVDPGLVKAVGDYWQCRATGGLEASYAGEAPHTRYQLPMKKYLSRFKKARKLNKVVLLKVDRTDDLAVLLVQCVLQEKRTSGLQDYVIRDRWVKLRGKWYHVVRNTMTDLY